MENLIFAVVAVALYLISDWILQRMEMYYGRRFEQRNLIFFFILSILAISSFALIRSFNLV